MKNFKIVSKISDGGDIRARGFKRLSEKERCVDFSGTHYSQRMKDNLIDDFEDGFNHIIEDENGTLYEAEIYFENKKPIIYRQVERA